MMRFVGITVIGLVLWTSAAIAAEFNFGAVPSLDAMSDYARQAAPMGTPQSAVRDIFVGQGGAKLYQHPETPGVEKYVYDINLCKLYVWRWNISANFGADGGLTQIFVNGEPVHAKGDRLVTPESVQKPGRQQGIYKGMKPRPEASEGENAIAYLMYDVDTSSSAVTDEFINGAGPSRADPKNLGKMHVYSVERWRSIFDDEPARKIVSYPAC